MGYPLITLNNTCASNIPCWFQAEINTCHTSILLTRHCHAACPMPIGFGVLVFRPSSVSLANTYMCIFIDYPPNPFFSPGILNLFKRTGCATVGEAVSRDADSCQRTPWMFSCSTSFFTKSNTDVNNRRLLPFSVTTFIRIIEASWLQVLDYVTSVIVVRLQLHRGYHIKPAMYTQLPTSSRYFQVINLVH